MLDAKNKVENINLYLSKNLKDKLVESAKMEGITVDKYIEKILIKRLKK